MLIKIRNRISAIKIVENLILGCIKFYILALCMLSVGLDDYLIQPSLFEKILIIVFCFIIVILLDLIVNFIIYKFINKKENVEKYKSLIYVSLIVTLFEFVFLLIISF